MANAENSLSHYDLTARLDETLTQITRKCLPPEDIRGHLADCQVYQSDLDNIGNHIARHYPAVTCAYVFKRSIPELIIEIEAATPAARRHHGKLRAWIEHEYPAMKRLSIFVHGPLKTLPAGALQIYPSIQEA